MGNETSSNPGTPSDTPTSEQLSVLSVSSRRKSSVGSNLQQTPEEPPQPDLSHLTADEIAQINSVICRAKEMEEEEDDRVRRLEEDYASYTHGIVQRRSVAEQEYKGQNLCPICHKVEIVILEEASGEGINACVDCQRVVCEECGLYETSLVTKLQEWVCHICQRRRRLVLSTGLWYHGFHPAQERVPGLKGLDSGAEGGSAEDVLRPALARSLSVNGYREIPDEKRARITRQNSLPVEKTKSEAVCPKSPDTGQSVISEASIAEEVKPVQGHSRLKGVGTSTKSDSEDMSDFASDVDMEDLTTQRVRGDGSSQEDVSDEYSLMSIVSTTTDDTEDYFSLSRRPRPRSLNLSRSHSATSSDDDTEYTEHSGAKLSDEEADLNYDAEPATDHDEFRRALEGLSAMAQEHDDLDDFPTTMHVSIPRTHSLSIARENGQFDVRQVYSPSPPRSPSWREGLESPPFSPRRKDSYPGKRRSISSPVSPKDKRHAFTYTDMSPPSRQISLDELYGDEQGITESQKLHGAMNAAHRPTPLSPDEVKESFMTNSGGKLHLDKPMKIKRNVDGESGGAKSRKYKDHDSIGVVDLASFAATVASNTASLTSMSVSPTNLRVVEDLHHTELSPDSQTSTESTSPGSPGYSDEHSYSEDAEEVELADPASKTIDYQNTKRQKQRPPSTSADWSPVVDLSPILDVSPSIEEAEQEDMLAQQEALRLRMERIERVCRDEEAEGDERIEKVEILDREDDHDYQELNLIQGAMGPNANTDDEDFLITPLKRYHDLEDMSQIDNANLYEKAEAFGRDSGFEEDRHHLPVLYELPELCATSNFESSPTHTVSYSCLPQFTSGDESVLKGESKPSDKSVPSGQCRKPADMETIVEINGNVAGWSGVIEGSLQTSVALSPVPAAVTVVSSPQAATPRSSTSSPSLQSTPSPSRVRRKLPKPTPEIVATQKKPSPLKPAALTAWLSSSLARSSDEEQQDFDKEKSEDQHTDVTTPPMKVFSRVELFEKLGSSQEEETIPIEKPKVAPKPTLILVKQDSFEKKRAKDLKAKPNPLVIKHIESEEQTMSPQYKVMDSPLTPEKKVVRRDYCGSGSLSPPSSPDQNVHIYPSPVSPLDSDSSPPKPQSPSSAGMDKGPEKFTFSEPLQPDSLAGMDKGPEKFTFCEPLETLPEPEPVKMVDKPLAPAVHPKPVKPEKTKRPSPSSQKPTTTPSVKPPPVKEKPKKIRRRLPSVPSSESTDGSFESTSTSAESSSTQTSVTSCTDTTVSSKALPVETDISTKSLSKEVHIVSSKKDSLPSTQSKPATPPKVNKSHKPPPVPEKTKRTSESGKSGKQPSVPTKNAGKLDSKTKPGSPTQKLSDKKSNLESKGPLKTAKKQTSSSPLPAKRKTQSAGAKAVTNKDTVTKALSLKEVKEVKEVNISNAIKPTSRNDNDSKVGISNVNVIKEEDSLVTSMMREAADKEVKRIIEEAEQYCRNNGVVEDEPETDVKGPSVSAAIAQFEEKQRVKTQPVRTRKFPVERDVDMILQDSLDESDLFIDSLNSIYGVAITSAMKSLKRRIIEELKSATKRRRRQLEEIEEIKVLEYQIEQLKLAKLSETISLQGPIPTPRGGRRTYVPSDLRTGQVVHRTRSESPARRTPPSLTTDAQRKTQRSMSPSRTSQVPQRRSRHRRQASDPSIVKFSPIKEDKDIEASFQAKLDEPMHGKHFERYHTDDSSQSGHSDAESSRSEPLNSRYHKVKPVVSGKIFLSGKSMSADRLEPEYCTYSGLDRLTLLESVSDPHLAEFRSSFIPDEEDSYEREERKYVLRMEINKRKRQLEETARLQHELMRMTRDPDTLYHSYDDIPIQYRSNTPGRPIPTGIIRPLDDEMPRQDTYTVEDYRLLQELLARHQMAKDHATVQTNYSSTEYLAHKQEEFRRHVYDDYTQYDDPYSDDVEYREQRTRDWVPSRQDRLDGAGYPVGDPDSEAVMSASATLPEIYSRRSDIEFSETPRGVCVIYHSDTDTNSPASDFTPAMPLLDDITTRSRKIIHSIGSRPNSAEFNFPGGVEDLLNAIHRVESDNSVDADEPIMKHMTEGGVTILKQLERKRQPPPQEKRIYMFPTKRILLTRDPRERSIRGNGIGMKIVGGKRYPGTHDLVAYVQAIYPGGVAEQLHGELQEGDQIVEWNGVPLTGRTYEDVQHIISLPNGEIELLIRPGTRLSTKLSNDCSGGKSSSAPESRRSSYDNLDDVREMDDFDRCFAESHGVDPDQLAAELEGIDEPSSPVTSPTSVPTDYATPSMSSACSTPQSEPASSNNSSLDKYRLASERAPMLENSTEMGDIQIQLSYDDYDNTLNVHIIQARNLLPKDMNGLSDPFVKVYLLPGRSSDNKRRTKHIPCCLNPEWHQTIMFQDIPREEIKCRVLEFTVWDYDRFKMNDFLGEVVIDLSDDAYLDNKPHWYPLSDHDENTSAELPKPTVLPPPTEPPPPAKPKGRQPSTESKGSQAGKTHKEPIASEEKFSQGLGRRKSLGNMLEIEKHHPNDFSSARSSPIPTYGKEEEQQQQVTDHF